MKARRLVLTVVLVVAAVAIVALAASAATSHSSAKSVAMKGCGLGNGKKATGTPIKLDGLDMLIPGVDFTTIGKVAAAYFSCVNDNGGINGRPIKYTLYTAALNPAPEDAPPRKLTQHDNAV